jgi:hypothetical protein
LIKESATIIAATLMVVAVIEIRMIKVENDFFLPVKSFLAMRSERFNGYASLVKIQINY